MGDPTASEYLHSTGFTPIELLVVIAIIAILAEMLLPALAKAKDLHECILGGGGVEQWFADQSHFTCEFRRQFGRTPRDYREHYKTVSAVSGTKSAVPKQYIFQPRHILET